jgi:hypothetical protein
MTVNDELGKMWKEGALAYFKVKYHYLKMWNLRLDTEICAKNRTHDIPNMKCSPLRRVFRLTCLSHMMRHFSPY